MLFPSRYLVKNCRRCGKNIRIEKDDLEGLIPIPDVEFYCPYCDSYIGRIVLDKDYHHLDIEP